MVEEEDEESAVLEATLATAQAELSLSCGWAKVDQKWLRRKTCHIWAKRLIRFLKINSVLILKASLRINLIFGFSNWS